MFLHMNHHLQKVLSQWGYQAATPEQIGTLGPDRIYSNWSQRHIAYAAGLGTFGMNNMLITQNGCCGRFYSLVTDLPVLPGKPLERENCLYKREGNAAPVFAAAPQRPYLRSGPSTASGVITNCPSMRLPAESACVENAWLGCPARFAHPDFRSFYFFFLRGGAADRCSSA